MGTDQSQSGESVDGYLHIETTSRNFQAGETVQGVIQLHLDHAIQAKTLYLKFKGVEIGMWNQEGTGFQVLKEREHIPESSIGRGHPISQRFPVFEFKSPTHGPGQFSYPFDFVLPTDIPGSFHLSYGQIDARITYSLTAFLEGSEINVKKTSLNVYVNQLMSTSICTIEDTIEARIKTGCICTDQGVLKLKVSFLKSSYEPGENVQLIVEANNENCRVPITGFEARLYRTLRITSSRGTSYVQKDPLLESAVMQRVPPASSLLGDQSVQMKIAIDDKHHDIMNAVTVRGRYVECVYSVCVKAIMDSCLCGGDLPEIERHLQIHPKQLPLIGPFLMPPRWEPKSMPLVSFNAGSDYHEVSTMLIDHREQVSFV